MARAAEAVLLSEDLLGRVLDLCRCGRTPHLDVQTLCTARLVCSLWEAVVALSLSHAHALSLRLATAPALARLVRRAGGGSGICARHLRLTGPSSNADGALAALERVRRAAEPLLSLGVTAAPLSQCADQVARFLASPSCQHLQALDLSRCTTTRLDNADALSAHSRIFDALRANCTASLRELDLSGPPMVALTRSDLTRLSKMRLRVLNLHRCGLVPNGLCGLLEPDAPILAHLEQLDVGYCSLSANDVEEVLLLLGGQLTRLGLADAPIRAASFARAAAAMVAMRELDLDQTDVLPPPSAEAARAEDGSSEVFGQGALSQAFSSCRLAPAPSPAAPLLLLLVSLPSLRRLSVLRCTWLNHDGLRMLGSAHRSLALTHDLPPPQLPRAAARRSPPPDSWESLDESEVRLPRLVEVDQAPRVPTGHRRAPGELFYTGVGVMVRPRSIYHVSQGDEPLYGNARPRSSAFDGTGLLRS